MIRVTIEEKSKNRLLIFAPFLFSSIAHFGFFYAADDFAKAAPTSHGTSRVEFRARALERPPSQRPEKKVIEIKAPSPISKAKPKLVKKRAPKPNVEKAQPEKTPPEKPIIPVFGVTAGSVTNGTGTVAVRVGNTLAKKMEPKFTKQEKVAPAMEAAHTLPKSVKPKRRVAPVPVYKLTKAPSFKKKIEPKYPEEARQAGIEGIVHLEVLIDEQGRVSKIRVLKTLGHGLDRAAISAVSKSVFHPGIVGGKAVPVKIKIPYKFMLDS
ncbi:MAG: energy transducer TonB [Proteobacteria bacterium]|nr:energy transducer TonB [Pseudomonadota bacterium]